MKNQSRIETYISTLQSFRYKANVNETACCVAENKPYKRMSLYRAGAPLFDAYVASTWLARLKGLHAYPPLKATEALVLVPCSSVHTYRLRYAIDVAFLDREGHILKHASLKPGSIATCRKAFCAVELACGTVQRLSLCVGQQLTHSGKVS